MTQNAQSGTQQSRTYLYDWLGRMTQEQNPESGTFKYSYDSDSACPTPYTYSGDLVKRTDAVNNVTCYQYDALHRITASLPQSGSPSYSQTPQKHYVYDQSAGLNSMGRLGHAYTCPANSSGTCSSWTTDLGFVYTPRGELTSVYELTPHSNGGYYNVTATYWPNGLINNLSTSLSGLPTWTYNPEGEGRVTTVTASSGQNPVPTGTPVTYNLYGLANAVTFGSNDSNSFQYDSATGRMTQYQATVNGSSMTGVLTWNPNGSLRQLAITDPFNSANSQTCTYQHDDLARIAAVNCGTGKWNQSYSYGQNGFGNVNWTGTGLGTTFTPTYNAANNHFASLGSYDSNGSLLTDGTHTYTWDADGELYQILSGSTTTTMTYDALGRRVDQTVGTNYTEILYGPGGDKLALVNGYNQTVISLFLPLPAGATAVYAGTTLNRYRHADWLGSARISSTTARAVAYDGAYSPVGESYSEYQPVLTDRSFTRQNQDLTTGSSGDLYDFLYREYHPIHGRWISPDPAGLAAVDPANPQTWNRYSYVANSPCGAYDLYGLATCALSIWVAGNLPDNVPLKDVVKDLNTIFGDQFVFSPAKSAAEADFTVPSSTPPTVPPPGDYGYAPPGNNQIWLAGSGISLLWEMDTVLYPTAPPDKAKGLAYLMGHEIGHKFQQPEGVNNTAMGWSQNIEGGAGGAPTVDFTRQDRGLIKTQCDKYKENPTAYKFGGGGWPAGWPPILSLGVYEALSYWDGEGWVFGDIYLFQRPFPPRPVTR